MKKENINLIVLYGVSGVGKSSIALHYSYSKGIKNIIGTDYIREIQRMYESPLRNPFLFKVTHNSCDLLNDSSPEGVINGFEKHVESVTPGIIRIIEKYIKDGNDAVIEGVHFNSKTLKIIKKIKGVSIHPILLTLPDGKSLQKRISHKLKSRKSGEKKDWMQNFTKLQLIQDYLIKDAKENNILVIENQKKEETLYKLSSF